MFTPHFYIDSFQSTKRIITNNVIKDTVLNKAANDYITAQTTFAKMLANNAIDLTKYSVDSISKILFPQKEQATQAPYKAEAVKPTRKSKKAKTVENVANTDINTQGE